MVNYQYFYITWVAIYLLIWLFLFYWRKDVRKEMILISSLFGIGGMISEITHIQDWWQPLTMTNTLIGIEDFLIGFFIGGIVAVIYEELYKKRIRIKREKIKRIISKTYFTLIVFVSVFIISFWIFDLHSFYSASIAFVVGIIIILSQRKDLIKDSMVSGILFLILGAGVYGILAFIFPGFIKEFWFLEDVWFSKLFLGIPLAEYIWHFLAGAFIGPLYEYWQEGRLVNKK